MIRVECDVCYRSIAVPAIGQRFPSDITIIEIVDRSGNGRSACDGDNLKTLHVCSKCKTERRTFYIENPYYVEPPEAAKDEQKASQGG